MLRPHKLIIFQVFMVILLFLYTFVLAFTLVRLPQIWHSFSGDFPQITDMHLHYNRGMYETCGGIGIERFVTRPRTNMCRGIFLHKLVLADHLLVGLFLLLLCLQQVPITTSDATNVATIIAPQLNSVSLLHCCRVTVYAVHVLMSDSPLSLMI